MPLLYRMRGDKIVVAMLTATCIPKEYYLTERERERVASKEREGE